MMRSEQSKISNQKERREEKQIEKKVSVELCLSVCLFVCLSACLVVGYCVATAFVFLLSCGCVIVRVHVGCLLLAD